MAIENAFITSLRQLGERLRAQQAQQASNQIWLPPDSRGTTGTWEDQAQPARQIYISPTNAAAIPTQTPPPQGYISPTNQAAQATQGRAMPSRGTTGTWDAQPASPVWNWRDPSPLVPPSRGTTGTWDTVPSQSYPADQANRIPQGGVHPYPAATPTSPESPTPAPAQSSPQGYISPTNAAAIPTQAPVTQPAPAPATTPAPPPLSPPGYISPTNQTALAAVNKVTHTVESDAGKTTVSHQAKQPKQAGGGSGGAPATAAPGAPTGPAPATRPAQPWTYGAPPAQTQDQTVNLQLPAHPGLLQRIGQTVSHFFGGTLGQHQQPQQPWTYGAPPPQDQTGGSALNGVSRALTSGRHHVATHGGSPPASAPSPTLAMAPTGYVSGPGTAAGGPTGQATDVWTETGQAQPLGDTDTVRGPNGELYRYDITNPKNYTRIQ